METNERISVVTFFFFTEPMPNPEPVGCFWDYFDRALPDHYANFRDQIIWKNMNLTVNQCARVAQDKGYEYFAVQYYGECYGGKNAENTYSKYGKSTYCWKFDKQNGFGVGRDLANFVYRINQVSSRGTERTVNFEEKAKKQQQSMKKAF